MLSMFHCLLQAPLASKRDDLQQKLEDVKLLKDGIDRRYRLVTKSLHQSLTEAEFRDYRSWVDSTCRLRVDMQWTDDRLRLAEDQLSAVRANLEAAEDRRSAVRTNLDTAEEKPSAVETDLDVATADRPFTVGSSLEAAEAEASVMVE